MSSHPRSSQPDRGQEERIRALQQEAAHLAGGKMIAWDSGALTPEAREQFWQRVVAFEHGPWTTNFQQLIEAGVALPEPEAVSDADVTARLWEVIEGLARIRVYLNDTDHLSDRQLYAALWHDVLREEVEAVPDHPDSAYHVSLVGSGSEEHTQLYLKYYADEDFRLHWAKEFPDEPLPRQEEPPFDRDRLLPQADWLT